MKYLIRELSKFLMFAISVIFPIALWSMSGQNNAYLWFYIVSALLVIQMFSHFETLEKIDAFTQTQNTKQNEQKETL